MAPGGLTELSLFKLLLYDYYTLCLLKAGYECLWGLRSFKCSLFDFGYVTVEQRD